MIAVGDLAPALERTVTQVDMVAYAGATWDWHRLHFDPVYLAAKGVPAPVVDGQLFGALLADQLLGWLGPRAELRRLSLRYRQPMFAGETARCTSTVSAVEQVDEGLLVEFNCGVEVLGEPARAAVAPATATALVRR